MTASNDGCLHRPGRQKTASATLYLMEELGDARLRCDQLVRYLDEAVKLIEKSEKKEHFFEVAGHLIHALPETAFKLQKALQAVALAADRLDYEELKQELRPEKVDELEKVLKEVRIRHVQHRSHPGEVMKPKEAAEKLRKIARIAREEGAVPLREVASFIRALDPSRKANALEPVADTFEKIATALEQPSDKPHSRIQLAALVSRIVMEAELGTALRFASRDEVQGKTALAEPNAVSPYFDNIRTLSVQAFRYSNAGRWRLALMSLFDVVDNIGTILVHLGSDDTQKTEALKREIRRIIPHAAQNVEDAMVLAAMEDEERRSKFEEGKPADPTENMSPEDAKKWKAEHEKNKDKFKGASLDDPAWEV